MMVRRVFCAGYRTGFSGTLGSSKKRKQGRQNVMIYNVQVSESDNTQAIQDHDRNIVESSIQNDLKVQGAQISKLKRVGKLKVQVTEGAAASRSVNCRPLKVSFTSIAKRNEVAREYWSIKIKGNSS